MSAVSADWLEQSLVCPRDQRPLSRAGDGLGGDTLVCDRGHDYAVVDGIPVLLVEGGEAIHGYLEESLAAVQRLRSGQGLGFEELETGTGAEDSGVDPWVQKEIVATCGGLYVDLVGRLPRYPIPELRLPAGGGRRLLDVGCNWGRWTIAADRAGYDAVGIDPSLRALLAARRVARQLGAHPRFVVADARRLPFADATFDLGFSYSVFQHFPRQALESSLRELARVTRPEGVCRVQMANRWGLRQLYTELRQRREPENPFAVRRYGPGELKRIFEAGVGPSELGVDGFFTLNAQATDADLLPRRLAWVVRASEWLRRLSARVPLLWRVADSLEVRSRPRPPLGSPSGSPPGSRDRSAGPRLQGSDRAPPGP